MCVGGREGKGGSTYTVKYQCPNRLNLQGLSVSVLFDKVYCVLIYMFVLVVVVAAAAIHSSNHLPTNPHPQQEVL